MVSRREARARGACSADDVLPSFGPYRVHRRLGAGGMGSVWLAQQQWPVRRWVALKVVEPDGRNAEVVWRFGRERRALAALQHPHIAAIHDAGATPQGRLFLAMELVDGPPITQCADALRLSVEERLALLLPVCDAVQHAHQRGVIHRDLKPSNVLVAAARDALVPKVIDFGVAKAVGALPAARSSGAARARVLGTPSHMSPEQAARAGARVDGRTDVWALGVLLYELLTGALPLPADALCDKTDAELRRTLRRAPVPPPSARVHAGDAASEQAAAARSTTAPALRARLQGDLDRIVGKALAKSRAQRYATPRALADDLRRHLRGEPVEAGLGKMRWGWLRRV